MVFNILLSLLLCLLKQSPALATKKVASGFFLCVFCLTALKGERKASIFLFRPLFLPLDSLSFIFFKRPHYIQLASFFRILIIPLLIFSPLSSPPRPAPPRPLSPPPPPSRKIFYFWTWTFCNLLKKLQKAPFVPDAPLPSLALPPFPSKKKPF